MSNIFGVKTQSVSNRLALFTIYLLINYTGRIDFPLSDLLEKILHFDQMIISA
jgi:hypothetical protein